MLRPLTDEQINTMMDVATQAFADHGFVGANVNKIARNAGVSIGVLYKYFETKEGLFITCVKRCLEFLDEVFERTFSIAKTHQTKNGSVNDGSNTGNVVHQEFISKDELMALISNLIREEQIAAKNHPEYFRLYHQITVSKGPYPEGIAKMIEEDAANLYCSFMALAKKTAGTRQDMEPAMFAFFFDNLMMMLHFAYTCDYYDKRFKIYCNNACLDNASPEADPSQSIADNDDYIHEQMMKFIEGALFFKEQ